MKGLRVKSLHTEADSGFEESEVLERQTVHGKQPISVARM